MDRGDWRATYSPRGRKEPDMTETERQMQTRPYHRPSHHWVLSVTRRRGQWVTGRQSCLPKVPELEGIRDKVQIRKPEEEDFCSEIVGVPTPAFPAWGKAMFFS